MIEEVSQQLSNFIDPPSSGPSKKGPGSGVRRIYPTSGGFIRRTIHMEGSSPEDLSVGPSVINRSRTIHMEGSRTIHIQERNQE